MFNYDGLERSPSKAMPQWKFGRTEDGRLTIERIDDVGSEWHGGTGRTAKQLETRVQTHGRTYVDVTTHPAYEAMPDSRRRAAKMAETVLNLSEVGGYVDLGQVHQAFDFGAGAGGPTLAVATVAEMNGGEAEAIDQGDDFTELMVSQGILDARHARQGDGIAYLNSDEAAGKYDLITAFMFGPDSEGGFAETFLGAAEHALADGGRVLIASEYLTMEAVGRACEKAGAAYHRNPGVPISEGALPTTIIAAFD